VPTPPEVQGLLRYGVYEAQDDANTREDVDHREELADRRCRYEIPVANRGERGDAEEEGIHYTPSLDPAVEDRPAQQSDEDYDDEGTELRIAPPGADYPSDYEKGRGEATPPPTLPARRAPYGPSKSP
jgi:hypothetical protein